VVRRPAASADHRVAADPFVLAVGQDGVVDDAVRAYLDAIGPTVRPLFDRIQGIILGVHPEADIVISYDMPTYVVGERRLHVAAWKGWVSLYGWDADHDGGLVARFPSLSSGRGTLKVRPVDADAITDDELRALVRGALDPRDG
jgi:hypothetical protein